MIVALGQLAVIAALIVSLTQAVLPILGAARRQTVWMQLARPLAYTAFILVLGGFLALIYAHATDDFTVVNVVMNSHTHKPMLYKITGAWASHEGSMMLWVLILTAFGAAMAVQVPDMPLVIRARALAVQGMIGSGFLSFILLASNPFARVTSQVLEGNDLNPLLQDPGLAFHPPFLYIGYVGFSSVFALAAALLLTRETVAQDIRWLRPWAITAWAALTFGIAMGSWWAYYELGWGGWWFWDPVENAALMPWLAGTALVHSIAASSKRGVFMRWTVLLAIVTFSLSLLGTFLVRSGILTSVHSFAVDPRRGIFVLILMGLAVGGALTLYALRSHRLPHSPLFAIVSRETALLLNNLFLCTACATLLTGTLYPLFLNALNIGLISVGAPYFNAAVVPLLLPLLAMMVVGPFLSWQKADLAAVAKQLSFALLLAAFAFGFILFLSGVTNILGAFAAMLGLWVVVGTIADARRHDILPHLSRLLAHGGLGIAILGMAGSGFSQEHDMMMQLHETRTIGGYRLEFADLQPVQGPNYQAERGIFRLTSGASTLTLSPEQRYYPTQEMTLSNVAIHTNLLRDLYLALGEEVTDNKGRILRSVRFHINPLVPWIWIGGGIMALGGLTSLFNRRARI